VGRQKFFKQKNGECIAPAIKYANSTYDEKMPKATICDACHADQPRWKSGMDRSRTKKLKNQHVFIDFGR